MNETQHFCLRWNNYQSSITSAFENLRDDEDFVDVTLACEGRSIKAHRVVLSACSPYFRDLLKSTPCKHPVILLQDVNYLDLLSLVEFIYHGEVNVHQKSLQSFLKTAEVLRVSGLTQQQAEETHSQLAHIQNLAAGGGAGTPVGTPQHMLHDDSPLYGRARDGNGGAASPPPPPPSASHLAQQITQLPLYRKTGYRRHERNSLTPSAEDAATMKRARGDNGMSAVSGAAGGASQNTSPDLIHQRSASPQLTPADFSTIKHNNNNTPPPQSQLKDEKPYFPGSNGNGPSTGNGPTTNTGNGLNVNDKIGSLTPSPMSRSVDDVKTEPMELVCGGGNASAAGAGSASAANNNNNNNNSNNNNNVTTIDENSNDSTGEHDANRSSCGEGGGGIGKGSMSSGNDDEIENSMPQHPPPPYLMSPAESKLFGQTPFNFAMSNLDPTTLAGLNSQFSQSAAEMAVSPQGSHLIRSAATSPTSSTSAPPSPPTALTSPNSSLSSLAGIGAAAAIYNSMHNSPPRPGSGPLENGHNIHSLNNNNNNNNNTNSNNNNNNNNNSTNNNGSQPQMPLRMPPPTSGGINEPQECPYCRRTFSCYYSLKRHFQDKHEQSDTLYVCEFCHRRYRTKNSLTTHKSLQHRGSSGMLKRLLKTSAIKNVLVPHPHTHHAHHAPHHHALTHAGRPASLFDFTSELGQPPPGIQ